jgi:hypothetical protein
MNCDEVKPLLPLYHAGASAELEREAIDAHLLDCQPCLRVYFAAKRLSEDAALTEDRPSPGVRQRLRNEVALLRPTVLGLALSPRRVFWVGALAAAAALLAFALFARRAALPAHRPSPLIDSDQAQASLSVL